MCSAKLSSSRPRQIFGSGSEIQKRRREQVEAREETRAKKVDAGLSKMRLEYANAATAYDVVTPTLLELQHLVEDMQKSKHGAVGKAQVNRIRGVNLPTGHGQKPPGAAR